VEQPGLGSKCGPPLPYDGHRLAKREGVDSLARITILDFEFTAHAIDALGDWGIRPDDLYDLLTMRHIVKRNRKDRAAAHILIGYDLQGRCLAAPITPTADPAVWRVITVWPCKPSDAAKLR
jgi:hypothetical protein